MLTSGHLRFPVAGAWMVFLVLGAGGAGRFQAGLAQAARAKRRSVSRGVSR